RLADNANVAVAAGGSLDLGAFNETVGLLGLGGTLDGTGTLTASQYQLAGGIVNANLGAGTLFQLSGTSLLNGSSAAAEVAVNGGTLRLGAADRLSNAATVAVASGATLDLQAFNETVGLLALGGTLAGTGTLSAAQYQLTGATVNANLGTGTLFQLGGTSLLNGTAGPTSVMVNGGTLRLGADERLANGATVVIAQGGTLDLAGRTETIGTLFGAATGTGTLALGGGRLVAGGTNADFGFGGAITGAGSIDKVGTGRLTLAGNFATTGTVNVLAGTLAFSGTTAGSLAVRGGTLIGSGVLGQSLTLASGTLAPGGLTTGTAGALGAFQAASLTTSGGTYAIDFGGASTGFASDSLLITGAATLAGTTVTPTALTTPGDYRFMQRYVVLQAGSLTGTFANGATFATVGNDASLAWRLRYDLAPNTVVLDVQRNVDFAAGLTGGSPNAQAVGNALNGAAGLASDGWAATLDAISLVPASQRAATYQAISGEAVTHVSTAVMFSADQFAQLLRQRATLDGYGSNLGRDALAMNGGTSNSSALRKFAAAAGTGTVAGDVQPSADLGRTAPRGGLWLQGFGGRQQLDGRNGLADTDTTNIGMAAGADYRGDRFVVGFAGAYSNVDTDVDDPRSTLTGDQYQGALYAGYDDGRTFANGQLSYFSGQFDITRQLTIGGGAGTATGEAEYEGYTAAAVVGQRMALGRGTELTLQAGAQHMQVTRDGFTETASGGLGLIVDGEERELFTISGDARISQTVRLGQMTVRPWVQLGVRWNTGDLESLAGVRFSGAPTGLGGFVTEGAALDRVTGSITGGLDLQASDRVSIGVEARTQLGAHTTESQLGLRVRVAF
ncbi:MAG TPA: autotransporter domain-containing protein, partial [Allosphingosinicella sp.]